MNMKKRNQPQKRKQVQQGKKGLKASVYKKKTGYGVSVTKKK